MILKTFLYLQLLLRFSTLVVGEMNHGQQSGEAKHEDDAALTEFLASLMDYTPTVYFPLY